LVRNIPHDRRYNINFGQVCRPPAAFTGYQFELTVARCPDHDGLDHALRPDRAGQLFQFFFIKNRPGLITPGVDDIKRKPPEFLA
jgi:hypothetical protein